MYFSFYEITTHYTTNCHFIFGDQDHSVALTLPTIFCSSALNFFLEPIFGTSCLTSVSSRCINAKQSISSSAIQNLNCIALLDISTAVIFIYLFTTLSIEGIWVILIQPGFLIIQKIVKICNNVEFGPYHPL